MELVKKTAAIDAIRRVEDYLDRLPPVMPEVIRCGECKHWVPGYIIDQPESFVPPKCGKYQQMVGHSASDYCSLTEREGDGNETGID